MMDAAVMAINSGWLNSIVIGLPINRETKTSLLKHFIILTLLILTALLTGSCKTSGLEESEGYVDVPGGRVWYRVIGSGEARLLLLLHGGPGGPSEELLPLQKLADAYIKALREFLNSIEQQEKG